MLNKNPRCQFLLHIRKNPNFFWNGVCRYFLWVDILFVVVTWPQLSVYKCALFCVAVAKINQELHKGGLHGENWSKGNAILFPTCVASLHFHIMVYWKREKYTSCSIKRQSHAPPLFCPTAHRGLQEEMVYDGWQETHVLQRSPGITAVPFFSL